MHLGCAQATIGDHLAFTANFQPTLILPILLGKLGGGIIAVLIAIRFSVPSALIFEQQDHANSLIQGALEKENSPEEAESDTPVPVLS